MGIAIRAMFCGLLAAVLTQPSRAEELLPADRPIDAVVDHYIDAGLKSGGVSPATVAGDANLLRRTMLDLVGRIPTAVEAKAYIESTDPDKRVKLVDSLVASPGFVRYQAYELDAMLMAGQKGSLRNYLLSAVGSNRAWNKVFRDLLLDKIADTSNEGTGEFLKVRADDPDKMANDVSVIFFGVNISCAKCHDHPLVSDWKQDHFYGMRSFFSRTFENGGFIAERNYGIDKFRTTAGDEKTSQLMFLTGAVISEPESKDPSDEEKKQQKQQLEEFKKNKQPLPPPAFSRRAQLIDVALKQGEDRYFARSIVNRVWNRLLGYGLVMPVDQMHSANPPSHPELLDWLARDAAEHEYDLRRLVRGIVLSDAYARGSVWTTGERPVKSLFAVGNVRPLTPQQYSTSLRLAGTSATALPADVRSADFEKQIENLDNAARGFANEIEMPGEDYQVSINEALLFSNSERIGKEFLVDGKGRLLGEMKETTDDKQMIEAAIWNVFGRPAESEEVDALTRYLAQRGERRGDACRQMLWALLTSAEFRFNY